MPNLLIKNNDIPDEIISRLKFLVLSDLKLAIIDYSFITP